MFTLLCCVTTSVAAHDPLQCLRNQVATAPRMASGLKSPRDIPLVEEYQAHIVLAVEGNFFSGTFAAIASVIESSMASHVICFHIFADCRSFPLLQRQATRFWCGYSTRGAKLTLYELDAAMFDLASHGCPQRCVRGVFAEQLRLYLPILLPSVDKALWIDSDGLMRGDAAALIYSAFTGANENRSIAGVLRPQKTIGQMLGMKPRDVALLSALNLLGLQQLAGYGPSLNGGLMALNLRQWRKRNLTGRIQELIPRLKRAKMGQFSGMSTASDAQTPMLLLCLNSTPIDVEPLPSSWNVDGLGWKRIPEEALCTANFLHWSGKHKPWNAATDRKARYWDLWKPYGDRVAAAQARYLSAPQTACRGLGVVQEPTVCVEQRIAAIDALANEVAAVANQVSTTENRRSRNAQVARDLKKDTWKKFKIVVKNADTFQTATREKFTQLDKVQDELHRSIHTKFIVCISLIVGLAFSIVIAGSLRTRESDRTQWSGASASAG